MYFRLFQRYYDAAATEGGGGTLPEPTAEQVAEQQELTTYLEKGESNLTPEEKTKFDTLKGKYSVEEVGEDGKPLTQEQKTKVLEEKKRLDTILAKPDKDRTVEDLAFLKGQQKEVTFEDIYKEVDDINGVAVEVDYKGIDPKTPQGIALREDAIRRQGAEAYDDELAQKYPRAYALMQHLDRGGDEEDFYKADNRDFSAITISKTDTVAQERVYRQALQIKGNSPDEIDALVQLAKDKQKLFDVSKSELEALQKSQKTREDELEQQESAAKERKVKEVNNYLIGLDNEIKKGIAGSPLNPKDQKRLYDFISASTSYVGNGKFVIHREVDLKQLAKEIGLEYFRMQGGNIADLAKMKGDTKRVEQFKKSINYKLTPRGQGNTTPAAVKPLGEL